MEKKTFISKFLLVALTIFLFIGTVCVGIFSVGYSHATPEELTSNFNVEGVAINYKNNKENDAYAKWETENKVITGSFKTESGMCGDTKYSGTLNLSYNGEKDSYFSFYYDVTLSGGSCTINGQSVSDCANKQFPNINVKEFDVISIEIGSGSTSAATTLKIYDFMCPLFRDVTLTFEASTNGSYKINNETTLNEGDDNIVISATDTTIINLQAIPNEGYKFSGWFFNDVVSNFETNLSTFFTNSTVIKPSFVPVNDAAFKNNGKIFTDLNEANSSANESGDNIIRLLDTGGTLVSNDGANTFTVSSGNILYIPNDSTTTICKNDEMFTRQKTHAKEFAKLTVPENTTLSVENGGEIYIGANLYAQGGNDTKVSGTPVGGYGVIDLHYSSSSLILGNASKLYCYGYIIGEGKVEAKSNSEVHEVFQVADFRGGSKTIFIPKPVFIFNQYFVQNIETTFIINSGANIKVHTALFASEAINTVNFIFLGDEGVFVINNGFIERKYDAENDRIIYNINGKAKLSSISLNVLGMNINSSDYVLPITNNFTINVLPSSEITVNQNLCFLPGVILNVEEKAVLRFASGKYLVVYDNDYWFGMDYTTQGKNNWQIQYSGTKGSDIANRTLTKDSPDATINLNGTIIINDNSSSGNNPAALYTTFEKDAATNEIKGGANIYSSNGTGVITFSGALGKLKNTNQVKFSGKKDEIPIGNATLKNGEKATSKYFNPNDYGDEILGKSIVFDTSSESWILEERLYPTYNITYINEETGEKVVKQYSAGKPYTFPNAADLGFEYNNYSLKKRQISDTNLFDAGQEVKAMEDLGNVEAIAVWGGWVNLATSYYYIDYETGEYLTGLNRVDNFDNSDKIKIHLFDENGLFNSSYTGIYNSNGKYYMVQNGIVIEDVGFYKFVPVPDKDMIPQYVYIKGDNSILINQENVQVYNDNGVLPSGTYSFDENGYVVKEDADKQTSGGEVYIKEDITYIDGIKVSYGLFALDGHYYYSDSNCKIVKNATHYVSITNGLNIAQGLYYFDENGYLCNPSNLQPMEVNA